MNRIHSAGLRLLTTLALALGLEGCWSGGSKEIQPVPSPTPDYSLQSSVCHVWVNALVNDGNITQAQAPGLNNICFNNLAASTRTYWLENPDSILCLAESITNRAGQAGVPQDWRGQFEAELLADIISNSVTAGGNH